MADFKLNYYFTKLKDIPFSNRQNFKKYFQKNYGEYQNINELIIKIERYQLKKYGNKLVDYDEFKTKEELLKVKRNAIKRAQLRKKRLNK